MTQKRWGLCVTSDLIYTYKDFLFLPLRGREKKKTPFPRPMTSMEVYKGFIIGQIRRVPKRAFCPGVRFRVASPFSEDQRLNVHTDEKYGPARSSPITPRRRLSLSMCREIRNPVRFSSLPPVLPGCSVFLSPQVWHCGKNWKIRRKVSLFQKGDADVCQRGGVLSPCTFQHLELPAWVSTQASGNCGITSKLNKSDLPRLKICWRK